MEEHLLSIEDRLLNLLHVVRILHVSNNKFILHLLDPLHGLSLRINVQSPSKTFNNEATILSGEGVSGQALELPVTSLGLRSHEGVESVIRAVRGLLELDSVHPAVN